MLRTFLDFATVPSNLIGLAGALGLLTLLLRWKRLGIGLLAIAVAALIVAGWTPLGRGLLLPLEDRFPLPQLSAPVAGIVLLGGAVDTHVTADRGRSTMNGAGERITVAAELAREFPDARVFLSGGAGHTLPVGMLSESAVARDVLVSLGVEPDRIDMEERSGDTCENASESLSAAKPGVGEIWVLVTSASHMPRAVACFRAAGFPVVPFPVDYQTRGRGGADLARPVASISEGLEAVDLAAHEWLGLLGYRLLGRTAEFFPAP